MTVMNGSMRNQNLWKKKRVLYGVIATAMMLMLTACGNNVNMTTVENTQTSSSSESQSVNSTEESEIETISTGESQKDFVMGQITEITEEVITVKLPQMPQLADGKLKSGDVELSDEPEGEMPSRATGSRPEGEAPSGATGSRPEEKAPSGEIRSRIEEASSRATRSRPEGELPTGESGAGPVGRIEDDGNGRLQEEPEYTGKTIAISLSDEVAIVINGAAGSASELKAGDTVTLQKDGDTITSIYSGNSGSLS